MPRVPQTDRDWSLECQGAETARTDRLTDALSRTWLALPARASVVSSLYKDRQTQTLIGPGRKGTSTLACSLRYHRSSYRRSAPGPITNYGSWYSKCLVKMSSRPDALSEELSSSVACRLWPSDGLINVGVSAGVPKVHWRDVSAARVEKNLCKPISTHWRLVPNHGIHGL